MLKEKIEYLLDLLENAPKSLNYASEIIDGCLDIMTLTKDNDEYKKFRDFDLRLSMEPISFMINEGIQNIEKKYWEDAISDLKFDLKSKLRQLQ